MRNYLDGSRSLSAVDQPQHSANSVRGNRILRLDLHPHILLEPVW